MRLAYADSPYLGCCKLYDHYHPDGRCWDDPETHQLLIERLATYDGWVMHLSVPSLRVLLPMCPGDVRVMSWVKPFAAFKRNVSVAYAWEPVIVKAARKPVVSGRCTMRDFIEETEAPAVRESITLKRGLTGAKPEKVCHWAFEMMGAEHDDEIDDLFVGSGAVTRAWDSWRGQFDFAVTSAWAPRLYTGGIEMSVQACPVCLGRGWMPYGFFTGNTVGTSTANETCRPCGGSGIVTVAAESSQAKA